MTIRLPMQPVTPGLSGIADEEVLRNSPLKTSVISGGEQVRCMLYRMMLAGANTHILDKKDYFSKVLFKNAEKEEERIIINRIHTAG
jgi:ABC-type uncharacterized transport system YnjBCD ATPase subunit